jgi:hypothetical protein
MVAKALSEITLLLLLPIFTATSHRLAVAGGATNTFYFIPRFLF